MAENTFTKKELRKFNGISAVLLILPLIALAGVILLFVSTGGGLQLSSPVPIESISVERTVLKPGMISINIRNTGPEDLIISQVIVNDATWNFDVSPSTSISRLKKAEIQIPYPWVEGEAYFVRLFSTNAVPFDVEIPVAFTTPILDGRTFFSFTLIGLYVGVIPIYLGLLWFPALRQLGRRWMTFLLAITTGLLVFLGVDTLTEAIEQALVIGSPFQGIGLIGIGTVCTFFLLDGIARRQKSTGRSEASQRMTLAFMIALGIGLHNLGEGLAIGAAYNVGEIALGAFLVVGFIIQNITEGLGIIAPVIRDRPSIKNLALMGFVGGAPAIIGSWIGAFTPSPVLSVLFLAVGTGAIFEVVYEIAKMIRKDSSQQPMPLTIFSGIIAGMLLLWVTGLLIK